MKPQNIELHIEELVLHGFKSEDRAAIGEAVQRELTRLFTEGGLHSSLHREHQVSRLDGGTFNVKHASNPATIGTQIAQQVYGGMKQ
jgi:hypothetical protein